MVLCTCEITWHRMREYSLILAHKNHQVLVVIKGRPKNEVRNLVESKDNIKNLFIPRFFFRPCLFLLLFFFGLQKKITMCLVDKKRTFEMVQKVYYKNLFLLEEIEGDYFFSNIKCTNLGKAVL